MSGKSVAVWVKARTLIITVVLLLVWGCGGGKSTIPREPIYRSSKNEEQVRLLQEKLRNSPEDLNSRMELGRIYLEEGMVADAIRSYEKVLSQDPKNVRVRLVLAVAYQRQDRPNLERVAQLLEEARRLAPQQADIRLNLGQVYQSMNKPDLAVPEFNCAMELTRDPDIIIAALLGLTAHYQRQGDEKRAQQALEAAKRIYPGIEEVLKERQILKKAPPPVYAGSDVKGEEGVHPHHEVRAKRAREKIQQLREKEKTP